MVLTREKRTEMKLTEKIENCAYNSNEELWTFSKEAWDRYLQYMEDMSSILNSFHGVHHSIRYWKLTVGKWLQYFLGTLFTNYGLAENNDAIDENYFLAHNYSRGDNFRSISFDDEMFSLLQSYITYYRKRYDGEKSSTARCTPTQTCPKEAPRGGAIGLTDDFRYLMLPENWFLLKKAIGEENLIVSRPNEEYSLPYAFDITLRKRLFAREYKDEFDFVLGNFVAWNLPFFYLEGYEAVCKLAEEYRSSDVFVRIFVADPTDYCSVVQDFYIANQVEKYGTEIVCVQHGGGYGMSPATTYFYDKDISDFFLTYGWGGDSYCHVPNILLLRNPGHVFNENAKRVLLISTLEMEHRVRPIGFSSSVGYRDEIFIFLCDTLESGSLQMEWRTYSSRLPIAEDMKNDIISRLGRLGESLEVDLPGTAMQRMHQARLVVLDHLSTTVLETIGAGIPTVMFWNPMHTPLTREAEEVCEHLRQVGILYNTPEEAAKFILRINGNVSEWWNSADVCAARDNFNRHFSVTSSDVLADYIHLFTGRDKIETLTCYKSKQTEKSPVVKEWRKKLFPHSEICSLEHLRKHWIFIFGAGKHGRQMARLLNTNGIYCKGFIDNAVNMRGQMIDGLPVYSLFDYKNVSSPEDIIVICIVSAEFEVKIQLIEEDISWFISMWQLGIL